VASAAFIALVPSVLYCLLVFYSAVTSGDLGGPLNLVLIPATGIAIGMICQLVIVPLGLLVERRRISLRLAIGSLTGGILLVTTALFTPHRGVVQAAWLGLALAVLLGAGFSAYLVALRLSFEFWRR
jgi:hypothetical protein